MIIVIRPIYNDDSKFLAPANLPFMYAGNFLCSQVFQKTVEKLSSIPNSMTISGAAYFIDENRYTIKQVKKYSCVFIESATLDGLFRNCLAIKVPPMMAPTANEASKLDSQIGLFS